MKKISLLMMILLLSIGLYGCGNTEETAQIDLTTPEGLTKEYIRLVEDYQHSEATGYLTTDYNNKFITFGDLLNDLKRYDVLTEENIDKGPEVVKTKDSVAKVWYEYKTGEYVKFELIKENDLWKVDLISFWSKNKDGDPEKVSLK